MCWGEDFIEALDKETELIYLANPNNPTGQLIPLEIFKKDFNAVSGA